MRTIWILGVAAMACGKGGGDDWTKRPVKPVSATAGGVAFTIDLPDGMRQKADGDGVRFDFLEGEYAKTPEVSIGTSAFAKTLDDYVKFEKQVDNWVRKDTLPDGGYIASHENHNYKGKEDYIVYAYRPFGDKVLTCSARVTPWTKGATTKDKVPLVEKMCLSLKPAK
jgi:hypothetical protein